MHTYKDQHKLTHINIRTIKECKPFNRMNDYVHAFLCITTHTL